MESMGERLKRLRIENGYTQEQVGKKLGIQKAAIGKYEHGNVENIKRSSILKLAELYNVTPSYILCFEETTQSEMDMLKNYRQLDVEDKAEIRGEIKQMLKADKYKTPAASIYGTMADDIRKIRNLRIPIH